MRLPIKTQKIVDANNANAPTCRKCDKPSIQRYCGGCDLFYSTCGCAFVEDGTPYNIDHTKCLRG